MKTIHAFSIALLLGSAAALGGFAATQTITGTQAQAAKAPASAAFVASRTARLDRWQHQLQRALHRALPKLPRLAHFARVPASAAPAPAFAAQSAAPAQRTIYVHAKAPPATHRHERDHEGEGAAHSEGGNRDD
jgi:hypothetical protein